MSALPSAGTPADHPVVIVAGGTGGVGRAICERLADDGYHVLSLSRGKTNPNARTAGHVRQVTCDVTSEAECQAAARAAMDWFGRIDAVIYAAIGFYQGTPESHDAPTISEIFAANVFGAHLLSSACYLAAMKKAGKGAICFIGSTAGSHALPSRSAYCASKAGLVGLCRALAVDWAHSNVRVNCVTTSYVATELEISGADSGEWGHGMDELRGRIPFRRMARPEEIAAAVAWVIGTESAYVTGTELLVDGGWSAWAGFGHF